MPNRIICEWEAPSYLPYVTLDSVYSGQLFSQSIDDDRIDYYEVDRFDDIEQEWMSIGQPRTPRVEFNAEDFDNATVRIRAVLRDGTKTPFVTSGEFQLFGMVAEFSNVNNLTLLSFI
jgi:hypothetical protein